MEVSFNAISNRAVSIAVLDDESRHLVLRDLDSESGWMLLQAKVQEAAMTAQALASLDAIGARPQGQSQLRGLDGVLHQPEPVYSVAVIVTDVQPLQMQVSVRFDHAQAAACFVVPAPLMSAPETPERMILDSACVARRVRDILASGQEAWKIRVSEELVDRLISMDA